VQRERAAEGRAGVCVWGASNVARSISVSDAKLISSALAPFASVRHNCTTTGPHLRQD
jgi:hypothetical protein